MQKETLSLKTEMKIHNNKKENNQLQVGRRMDNKVENI